MRISRFVLWLTGLATVAGILPIGVAAQMPCEGLANLKLKNATIASATSVAAGGFQVPAAPGQPAPTATVPAFCRVAGFAAPTADSHILFEVWLPASGWNGKFEQVGNGGLAGTIPLAAMVGPLLRGYATAATDDGHETAGIDASWALGHPEKVTDFAQRAVHETSVQAKTIMQAFYGKQATRSYFVGCSEGGREALMEAQRYPDDFIGVIAGAPANYWTHLLDTAIWIEHAVRIDVASAIPPEKLPVITKAAVAACDRLDGVADGVMEDPRACKFDPATVQCKGEDAADCLTAPQVVAVKKLYAGPKNPRTGEQIYPGFPPGTEAVPGNWAFWVTGGGPRATMQPLAWQFGNAYFSDIFYADPSWDFRTFNFDTDVRQNDEKMASLLNATNPDLTRFKARGGKLIQYHGWGDAAISPLNSVNYFESVQAKMATESHMDRSPLGPTASFYRLFMVPGMSHCGGGLGPNEFGNGASPAADAQHDIVTALDTWVEKGTAPDTIIGTGFVGGNRTKGKMTHPLCPYPQAAQYKGSGDTNDAGNFVCAVAKR